MEDEIVDFISVKIKKLEREKSINEQELLLVKSLEKKGSLTNKINQHNHQVEILQNFIHTIIVGF